MTAKEFLSQAFLLDRQIANRIAYLARLRKRAATLPSPEITDRVMTSRRGCAPYTMSVETIIDTEREVETELNVLRSKKAQIHAVIKAVDDPFGRELLHLRFVQLLPWRDVEAQLCVSHSTAMRHFDAALQKIIVPDMPEN